MDLSAPVRDDDLKPTLTIMHNRFRKADAMFRKSRIVAICVASSALAVPALAQHVYPVQKQSPEQQKQDEAHCSTWAMQQSGFDPAKPWLAPQASAPASTAGSSPPIRVGAAGTVAGAMTRRDAGDAAVAGAIAAASAQPAAGATTTAITRRETMAAVTGADGAASAQPTAAGAMTRRDATAALGSADGTASTSPASAAAAAIQGRDAGNVAAGGAVAGATVRRDANQRITLQQEQAASQQQPAGEAPFQKARTACLEARGYTVQ
jgi:hypothetical protein